MLVSVNLVDGVDPSADVQLYTTTMEVPADTDLDAMAQELHTEFHRHVIASTSPQFQKEHAEDLEDVNFLRWVTVTRIAEKPSTKEEFLEAAVNSMVNYSCYSSAQEIVKDYI